MNIKSYMRGIGAGMIVTALIMGVSVPKQKTPPIEKETLTETVAKNDADAELNNGVENISDGESIKEDDVIDVTNPVESTGKDEEKETQNKQEDDNTEPETEIDAESQDVIAPPAIDPMPKDDQGFTATGEIVEIRVISGDSSVSVSRRLYEAGLVESAVEFDKYLCENGYDKFICVGTYEIDTGTDFETMAKILTRRN